MVFTVGFGGYLATADTSWESWVGVGLALVAQLGLFLIARMVERGRMRRLTEARQLVDSLNKELTWRNGEPTSPGLGRALSKQEILTGRAQNGAASEMTEVAAGVHRAARSRDEDELAWKRDLALAGQEAGEMRGELERQTTDALTAQAELRSTAEMLQRIVPAAEKMHEDLMVVNERAAANVGTMGVSSRTTREIASALEDTAGNAGELAEISREATASVGQGEGAVLNTVAAVRRLRVVVEEFADTIRRVSEQSEEIGKSSELVASVAARTNLLSLNAAIEAARAGEAGRGFAIVAGEIRNLAGRAGSAATMIDEVLEDVKEQFEGLSTQMAAVSAEVQSSTELAERAGEELERTRELVSNSDIQVQGIQAAVEEMSVSGSEVAENLSDVAGKAAANVDTTNDMKQRAQGLYELALRASLEVSVGVEASPE